MQVRDTDTHASSPKSKFKTNFWDLISKTESDTQRIGAKSQTGRTELKVT